MLTRLLPAMFAAGEDHITALIKPEFGSALLEFLRSGKVGQGA